MRCQALRTLRGLVGTPLSTQMSSSGTLSDEWWDCRDQRQMWLLTLCWDPRALLKRPLPCPLSPQTPLSADPEALGGLHAGGWALAHGHGLHRPQGAQEEAGLSVERRPRRRECQPHEGGQGALW